MILLVVSVFELTYSDVYIPYGIKQVVYVRGMLDNRFDGIMIPIDDASVWIVERPRPRSAGTSWQASRKQRSGPTGST